MSLLKTTALAGASLFKNASVAPKIQCSKSLPIISRGLRGQNCRSNAVHNYRDYLTSSSIASHLSIWSIMRRFGIPHCRIVLFRRKLRRLYYSTRLSRFFIGAMPIIVGDLLAQTVYPHLFLKKKLDPKKKPPAEFAMKLKDINFCRTLHFALIGGFLVGPITKRLNLFWGMRVRRYPPSAFMTRMILLDVMLLTPLALITYMCGYDYRYLSKHYNELTSEKDAPEKLEKRYRAPLMDMALVYVMTKPIVVFVTCCLIASSYRNIVRKIYTYAFHCFVSHVIVHAKLGPEITKRKRLMRKDAKKAVHEGSGGLVCMAVDKISAIIRNDKN